MFQNIGLVINYKLHKFVLKVNLAKKRNYFTELFKMIF